MSSCHSTGRNPVQSIPILIRRAPHPLGASSARARGFTRWIEQYAVHQKGARVVCSVIRGVWNRSMLGVCDEVLSEVIIGSDDPSTSKHRKGHTGAAAAIVTAEWNRLENLEPNHAKPECQKRPIPLVTTIARQGK